MSSRSDEGPAPEEPATPLHDAAERGDVGGIRLLLDTGADCNMEDWRGTTPLYWAVDGGSAEAARVLLEAGADPDGGDTLMPPFVRSAQKNRIDMLRLLLQFGANPNVTDGGEGDTALMPAASHGNLEMVDLLLALGVSPHVVARKGWTALSFAQERGHADVVEMLKAAGAREPNGNQADEL